MICRLVTQKSWLILSLVVVVVVVVVVVLDLVLVPNERTHRLNAVSKG